MLTRPKAIIMHWILRVGTTLLLVGHGGFGVWLHKESWLGYFSQLGVSSSAVHNLDLFHVVGWFEIAFGLAVLVKPARPLLVAACAYKMGTELLRPMAGEPWWEFIERAGSFWHRSPCSWSTAGCGRSRLHSPPRPPRQPCGPPRLPPRSAAPVYPAGRQRRRPAGWPLERP